jgi:hypothetical protein
MREFKDSVTGADPPAALPAATTVETVAAVEHDAV